MEVSILIIIGIICVAIIIIGFIWIIFKFEQAHRIINKRLQNAQNLADAINNGSKTFFYKIAYPPIILDANGQETTFLPNENREIIFHQFSADSQVPSLAFALAVTSVKLKYNDFDHDDALVTIRILICPADHFHSQWTVDYINGSYIIFQHPVMGELRLDKSSCPQLSVGQKVTLRQDTVALPDSYRISYHLC